MIRADDGGVASGLLRSQSFDVLITDVDMPQMNGLALIADRDLIDGLTGIIVLSGRHDYKELGWLHSGQNVRFVPKPFSPTDVVKAVDEIMSSEPWIATL